MSVVLLSQMRIKNAAKLGEYRKAVGPMVRAAGGELLAKSDSPELIGGCFDSHSVVIFRFPSREAVFAWLEDPEYAKLIPLREAAAEIDFVLLED